VITRLQLELARRIERFAEDDGYHPTAISPLSFIRCSQEGEPVHVVHEPALCIVAQGKKMVILAEESYSYDPSTYLVISLDLPVAGQVVQASPDMPYLCLRLDLQSKDILDMITEGGAAVLHEKKAAQRGLFVSPTSNSLLEAVNRLVRLLEVPQDIPVLAPLVLREIYYRILTGEHGESVKQIVMNGSQSNRIAKAVELIKKDYNHPLRIEDLARAAGMSPSSLHHHFKEITAMSPLQFQKRLRLTEARRLLLTGTTDAATAGFQVGYESPSQFSREYSRLFGQPPISDIRRLRESMNETSTYM
jgi:AraC-like DNA-binding protein